MRRVIALSLPCVALAALQPSFHGDQQSATVPASAAGALQTNGYRLILVSLVDSSVRQLDVSSEYHFVAFSPRSGPIVAQTLVSGVQGFLSISPDGPGRREYPTGTSPLRRRPLDLYSLSPNGSRIAFRTQGDTTETLVLLDLATGKERALTAAGSVQQYRWRSADELDYVRVDDPRMASRRSVHRLNVDGQDRLLRVLSDTFRAGSGGVVLINDSVVIHHPRGRIDVIPLNGGEPRQIFQGPVGWMPSVSQDQRFLAVKTAIHIPERYDPSHAGILEADAVSIVDLRTGHRRDLPLGRRTPGMAPPVWVPDGQHVLVALRRTESTEQDLYLIPVDGGAPRLVFRDIGTSNFLVPVPTSDGRAVVLSVPGAASGR